MGKKKRLKARIEELQEMVSQLLAERSIREAEALEAKGRERESQIEQPIHGQEPAPGSHPDGTPHVIEAIGRAPDAAVYFCGCGERLVLPSTKMVIGAEGGPGLIEKHQFNPFSGGGKLPEGWICGKELKQLDTDSL